MGVTATVPILPGAAVNQERSYASYPQSRRRGSSGTVVATRLSTSGLSPRETLLSHAPQARLTLRFGGGAQHRPLQVLSGALERPSRGTRVGRRTSSSEPEGRHWPRTSIPRDPLRFKINCSPIAPIHVEGHGRVVVDDAPSPVRLPKTHRRAVPRS